MTNNMTHHTAIRRAAVADAERLAVIYNYYIAHTTVSFEEDTITPAMMQQRIADVRAGGYEWFVLEDENGIQGYAYAARWKTREAYRFTAEATVYLDPECKGKGYGTQLYQVLFDDLRKRSIRSVMGVVTLPNPASAALHEKFGMKKVAHFSEVGFKFNEWLDVGFWQGML